MYIYTYVCVHINPTKQKFHHLAAIFQAYHGTKKRLKSLDTDLHLYLTEEPNLISIRRYFLDCFCSSMRGMPGEESSIHSGVAHLDDLLGELSPLSQLSLFEGGD